jgi:homoserine acetyltransferase
MNKYEEGSYLSLSEKCHLFERFKKEEGALPDNLTIEYTKLIYSLENIQEKMAMGNSFYEVLSKIAQEVKALGINPDALVADKMIRDVKKEILKDEAN